MTKNLLLSGLIFSIFAAGGTAIAQTSSTAKPSSLEASIQAQIENRRASLKKYAPRIIALQKEVYKNADLFVSTVRKRGDAGYFLNPRLNWESEPSNQVESLACERFEKYVQSQKISKLALPELLRSKVLKLAPNELGKITAEDLKGIDFAWFKVLQQFDHWSYEENSPLVYIEKRRFVTFPIPSMLDFPQWAKLRLAKGLIDKNVGLAIDETLHLGRLIHSTELILGVAVSNVVARSVVEFAAAQKIPQKVTREFFDQSKIYFFGFTKFVGSALNGKEDLDRVLAAGYGPGYCAGLAEAGWSLFESKVLLENELKQLYDRFSEILLSGKQCRLTHLRKAWAGDTRYSPGFASVPSASATARLQIANMSKDLFSGEDFRRLILAVADPRWPQYFGYLYVLSVDPEKQFAEFKAK